MQAHRVDIGTLLFWMNTDTYSKDSCSAICLGKDSKKKKSIEIRLDVSCIMQRRKCY